MPGMNTNLSPTNATITSAFRTALWHQGVVVLVILVVVFLAWNVLRSAAYRTALQRQGSSGAPALPEPALSDALDPLPEPLARKVMRIGFGLIWVLDGLLQAQPGMPLGMIPDVVEPTAQSSPGWVQHLVNVGGTLWNDHPITAASAAVWIQLGIGLFLLLAPRGLWSRLAGASSVVWGLVVWVFGESFGGIFAPGSTWLFGTPGAVLFYCAAGLLIALPEEQLRSPRTGRIVLGVMGTFFLGMAALQAWPGNGFWQGLSGHNNPGPLTSMVQSMATTPQPHPFSSLISSFGSFVAQHGFAVNLFVVVALGAIGLCLLSGRPVVLKIATIGAAVLCISDWVLVQDLGFFGGVGTDPNSMIPMLVVIVGGYLVATSPATVTVATPVEGAGAEERVGMYDWVKRKAEAQPSYLLRSLAGIGAIGVVLLGAVPMAFASVNPHADPIVAQAIDGAPDAINTTAPAFSLVDQDGKTVSLSSLRHKVVALTFLDPVCSSDCPVIAQEFKETDQALGQEAKNVEFIAIVANPLYRSVADTKAFDRAEGLSGVSNWLYLTGSKKTLQKTWKDYGVYVEVDPAGAMVNHAEIAFVIGADGHTRYVLNADPGPGTQVTKASFATLLIDSINRVMAGS